MAVGKNTRLSRITAAMVVAGLATASAASTPVASPALKRTDRFVDRDRVTCDRQVIPEDELRRRAQALALQIKALIDNMASSSPEPTVDDYEASIVQLILSVTTDQAVQIAALEIVAAGKLSPTAMRAIERVLIAARACRLSGTAALSNGNGGFQPGGLFSAPRVDVGGGSVNYGS